MELVTWASLSIVGRLWNFLNLWLVFVLLFVFGWIKKWHHWNYGDFFLQWSLLFCIQNWVEVRVVREIFLLFIISLWFYFFFLSSFSFSSFFSLRPQWKIAPFLISIAVSSLWSISWIDSYIFKSCLFSIIFISISLQRRNFWILFIATVNSIN